MMENEMVQNLLVIKEDEQQQLLDWYQWVHDPKQRGERARLRRCSTLAEVLTQPGFHGLCKRLSRLESFALNGLALVAGLLVWAEPNTEKTLPELLGKSKEGPDKNPLFSELRFQRLLGSEKDEDFFQSMRRAIIQAGKKSEPLALADTILHWFQQREHPDWYQGQRYWQYRFAKPYYEQII